MRRHDGVARAVGQPLGDKDATRNVAQPLQLRLQAGGIGQEDESNDELKEQHSEAKEEEDDEHACRRRVWAWRGSNDCAEGHRPLTADLLKLRGGLVLL